MELVGWSSRHLPAGTEKKHFKPQVGTAGFWASRIRRANHLATTFGWGEVGTLTRPAYWRHITDGRRHLAGGSLSARSSSPLTQLWSHANWGIRVSGYQINESVKKVWPSLCLCEASHRMRCWGGNKNVTNKYLPRRSVLQRTHCTSKSSYRLYEPRNRTDRRLGGGNRVLQDSTTLQRYDSTGPSVLRSMRFDNGVPKGRQL
jgi:hypothetical protein